YVVQQPDGVPVAIAKTAATLFDYLRDYGDISQFYSCSEKLVVHADLQDYLVALTKVGFSVCSALRNTRLVGQTWADKTPWEVTIAYVFVARSDQEPRRVAVPKAVKMGP